jgi:hypothetical protein
VAYRFKLGEPVPEGIKRIVREEIEAAVRHLSGQGKPDRDEAIHEARKNVKKIRGVLRLMRPELGEIYRLENTHFRDIGRQLSQFRDAGAMIETFDALRGNTAASWTGARWRHPPPADARKEQAEKQGQHRRSAAGMAAALRQSAARVRRGPFRPTAFPPSRRAWKPPSAAGKKRMARARKHPRRRISRMAQAREGALVSCPAAGEPWNGTRDAGVRKEPEGPGDLAGRGSQPGGAAANDEDIAVLAGVIRKYSRTLRDKAFTLGEHMYNEKPGHLGKRFGRMWEAAQAS